MSAGIGLPTPVAFTGGTIASGDISMSVPVAADQYATLYNISLCQDRAGGGAVPIGNARISGSVSLFQFFPGAGSVSVPSLLKQPQVFPMGEDIDITIVDGGTVFTAGTIWVTAGIGGNMGSGTGLPTPRPYSGGAANGADWEIVITPGAGEHVVVYSMSVGSDALGTTTQMQLISGGIVRWAETMSAPGTPDWLVQVTQPLAFPKGEAVTARCTATTAGTITVAAALVY